MMTFSMTSKKKNVKVDARQSWLVEAEKGQKFNISMVLLSSQSESQLKTGMSWEEKKKKRRRRTFSDPRDELAKTPRDEDKDCLGLLVEPNASVTSLICGGKELRHVTVSQSHRLEVFVEKKDVEFVLLFEGGRAGGRWEGWWEVGGLVGGGKAGGRGGGGLVE